MPAWLQSPSRSAYSAWIRWPRSSSRRRPPSSTSSITNAHSTTFGAQLLEQRERRGRGAARREQVVDHEHALAADHGVVVDLEPVGAVLERVLVADRPRRQLARLAERHEARVEQLRDRGPEDEPRLDARDLVDAAGVALGEPVRDVAEARGVGEQRRDVAESDSPAWGSRARCESRRAARHQQTARPHGGSRPIRFLPPAPSGRPAGCRPARATRRRPPHPARPAIYRMPAWMN